MKSKIIILAAVISVLIISQAIGYKIPRFVVSNGGTDGVSTDYILDGTAVQTVTNVGQSNDYALYHGFWRGKTLTCDCFPGDCDGTGNINILDITCLIDYLYNQGSPPTPYDTCSGDADCNCIVNILDITYLQEYLYYDGPAPCSCSEWVDSCGTPLRFPE